MSPLRIALVVQGRFHAFDLARALTGLGHHVTVLTTYPRWAAARFDIGAATVESAWGIGLLWHLVERCPGRGGKRGGRAWLHAAFGRWAARRLALDRWDVVHGWSGVSEELLAAPDVRAACRILMRGSAHIVAQDRLLADEEVRTSMPIERPDAWMLAREQREYAMADRILVLSSFARDSFAAEGCASSRLAVLPLGVDVAAFRPSDEIRAARAQRIRSGQPLRVLYVGTLSARKGLVDLVETATRLTGERIEFRLVGAETPESRVLLARAGANVTRAGKVAQSDLPSVYHQSDVFLFPTIEDGFGLVLTQAKAAGLPIICTNHCAGPDLLTEGQDGWVVPIRSPEAMVERLRWCDRHRDRLALMADAVAATYRPPDWQAVAADFARLAESCVAAPASGEVPA